MNNAYPGTPTTCTGTPPYQCIEWAASTTIDVYPVSARSAYGFVAGTLTVLLLSAVAFATVVSRPAFQVTPGGGGGSIDAVATIAPIGIGQIAEPRACVTHTTTYDRIAPTWAQEARSATLVLAATVTSFEAPRWNTEGGTQLGATTEFSSVYRNVTFAVATVVKGPPAVAIRLRLPGGRVGCELFAGEGVPLDLSVGDRFALFVQDLPAADAKGVRVPTVVDAWPISSDGMVSTPVDGAVPIAQFEAPTK